MNKHKAIAIGMNNSSYSGKSHAARQNKKKAGMRVTCENIQYNKLG